MNAVNWFTAAYDYWKQGERTGSGYSEVPIANIKNYGAPVKSARSRW
jgi:hypothetical protein